ncbi:VOC family protein [uncultured Peptoniphilus sp.]|nr:VOC family protein [uncultured Peptoniphilus sp.]
MIKTVAHIGLSVKNLDRSIEFHRDILGLHYKGKVGMEGPSSDEFL